MHQALALALQSAFIPLAEYNSELPRFLVRWISMSGLVGALLLLPIASVLGAMAVPPRARFEQTQSALMTHLTPLDLCAGRLLASLWPVLTSLLASCGFWLVVQILWRSVPGAVAGYTAIVLMHFVLFCAVFMVGGWRSCWPRAGGRDGRGDVARALGYSGPTLCIAGILLVNPIVRRMNDPTRLISAALVVNPASAAAVSLKMDVLRLPWLYEHSDAPEYPFAYPPVWASCLIFAGIGVGAMALAARRTLHAYR